VRSMRIAVTLLALLGIPACGEATRRGDENFGASAVRFFARLTGPPMGYQAGDFLQPGLETVDWGGGGSRGNDRFPPETFPHAFVVEFTAPPICPPASA
jgi:hypothetical protein